MKPNADPQSPQAAYVPARPFSQVALGGARPAEERSAPHDTVFRKTHEPEW